MMQRRRNSLRLQGYNYSQAGLYFVTVVVKDRTHIFGEIVNEVMILNEAGKIVQGVWKSLAKQYPVVLDEFIVMPDHVHGIIELHPVGVGLAPSPKPIMPDGKPKSNPRPTQNGLPTNGAPSHTTKNEPIANDAQRVGLEYAGNNPSTLLASKNNKRPTPTGGNNKRVFLSDVIRFSKSLSAKRINIVYETPGKPLWQNGFHDRIIRDEEELNAVRSYIQTNPLRWALDKEVIL
jgi:putative transposase